MLKLLEKKEKKEQKKKTESVTMKKDVSKTQRKKRENISSQIILSVMQLFIFSSLLTLCEGGSGGDSLYFQLCHYQQGNSVRRMMATSRREGEGCRAPLFIITKFET